MIDRLTFVYRDILADNDICLAGLVVDLDSCRNLNQSSNSSILVSVMCLFDQLINREIQQQHTHTHTHVCTHTHTHTQTRIDR